MKHLIVILIALYATFSNASNYTVPDATKYKEDLISIIEDLSHKNTELQEKIITNYQNSFAKTTERNELILSRFDKFENSLNNKVNKAELDMLSTSIYERLRTTDDSITMWGTVSGWFATLLTFGVAMMALLHFGRIRELEKQTKETLERAKNDSIIAANAAVTRAGNEAKSTIENWITETGVKEIEKKVSAFNDHIKIAKEKILNIDIAIKEANSSVNNIKEKEKNISSELVKNNKDNDNNTTLVEHLSRLPSKRNFDSNKEIILALLSNNKCIEALDIIRFTRPNNDEQRTSISLIEIYSNYQLKRYNQVVKIHHKNKDLINNTATLKNIDLNIGYIFYCIVCSMKKLDYSTKEILTESDYFLNYLIENKIKDTTLPVLLKEICDVDNDDYAFTNRHLKMIIENYPDNKLPFMIDRFRFIMSDKIEKCYSISCEQFLNSASNVQELISAYVGITNHYLINKEWAKSLDKYTEIDKILFKSQKIKYHDSYIFLLLNRAYALHKIGSKRRAFRLATYVLNYLYKNRIYLDESGRNELNEILSYGNINVNERL